MRFPTHPPRDVRSLIRRIQPIIISLWEMRHELIRLMNRDSQSPESIFSGMNEINITYGILLGRTGFLS